MIHDVAISMILNGDDHTRLLVSCSCGHVLIEDKVTITQEEYDQALALHAVDMFKEVMHGLAGLSKVLGRGR